MKTVIMITDHAFDRIRERSGINKKAAIRLAERAFNNGLKHNETTGNVFKYISSIAANSHKGCNIRIYGDKVFVFNNSDKHNNTVINDSGARVISLVTVLQLPSNLNKQANAIKNKKYNT